MAGRALLLTVVLAAAGSVSAEARSVRLVKVGEFEQPLYVTAPPGDADRIFVVERGGTIRVVANGETRSRAFLRQPGVSTRNAEQGMLSMAFAPDYATSGRFYVVFTDARQGPAARPVPPLDNR